MGLAGRPEYRTMEEYVFHALKRAIVLQQFRPGEDITLQKLEQALGVSRTPIRQALRRLAATGFITILPHTRMRIKDLNVAEALELYRIRRALEVIAIEESVKHMTSEHLKNIRQRLLESERAYQHGDALAILTANRELHLSLYQPCGMTRLLSIIEDLSDSCERYRWTELSTTRQSPVAGEQHRQLYRAALRRDARAAANIVVEHINGAATAVLEALERNARQATTS